MSKPMQKKKQPNHGIATGRFQPDNINVAEWLPPNSPIPTQVHILFRYGADQIIVRLKSRAVADELISALIGHTNNVWPLPPAHAQTQELVPASELADTRRWSALWKQAAKHWRGVAQRMNSVAMGGEIDTDVDLGWVCTCGHYQPDDHHCARCHRQPPWGCDCADCLDLAELVSGSPLLEGAEYDPYFDDLSTPADAGDLRASCSSSGSCLRGPDAPEENPQ